MINDVSVNLIFSSYHILSWYWYQSAELTGNHQPHGLQWVGKLFNRAQTGCSITWEKGVIGSAKCNSKCATKLIQWVSFFWIIINFISFTFVTRRLIFILQNKPINFHMFLSLKSIPYSLYCFNFFTIIFQVSLWFQVSFSIRSRKNRVQRALTGVNYETKN